MIILPPILIPSGGGGEDATWWDVATTLAGLVVVMWVFFTLIQWLFPLWGNPTLLEVLQGQWEWISTKRIL